MSANAEAVATAIATYLVEFGVHEIADQIEGIRLVCAEPWRDYLREHGFDDVAAVPLSDIADGIDVALARLVDTAQAEYDAAPTADGKTQPGAYYLGSTAV